jgi:hypothetical protein
VERLVFAATFLAFAWFHQGGGWNQNARFAMVRSIVEEGTFAIDSYLVYASVPSSGSTRLVRVPVRNGEFGLAGRTFALFWHDEQGRPIPLNAARAAEGVATGAPGRPGAAAGSTSPADPIWVEPGQVACTGDVAFHGGRFHPAKAPGGAFAAVPGYLLVRIIEKMAGVDPDGWWALTVNAWLASVLSVGLAAALGCVLLFRLAMALSGERVLASLLTALAFAFGTMFFSYATSLYEHDLVAVALLAAFYLLLRVARSSARPAAARAGPGSELLEGSARVHLFLAGLCAGLATITNYVMVVVVVMLGIYLVLSVRRTGGWRWFALGLLGPLLLLCAYHVACFGTPLTTNYAHEDPAFRTGGGALLGVFLWPQWEVLPAVLVSPFRGLFVGSPVLLAGAYGLFAWLKSGRARAEAWLFAAVLAFFVLFALTFNGWHGGWAVGPRYLVPALPFLALPAVFAFRRFPRTAAALATASAAIGLLVTAVDPQAPVGVSPLATVEGRRQWLHSPLTDYEWPLFSEGRAWPLLDAQRDRVLRTYDEAMQAEGETPPVRSRRLAMLRQEIDAAIQAGAAAPLLVRRGPDGRFGLALSELSTISGPVSANPMGVYEGWMYRVFPPGSSEARMNSFNAGELLFPGSRWSLAPLLAAVGPLLFLALRAAAAADRSAPSRSPSPAMPSPGPPAG